MNNDANLKRGLKVAQWCALGTVWLALLVVAGEMALGGGSRGGGGGAWQDFSRTLVQWLTGRWYLLGLMLVAAVAGGCSRVAPGWIVLGCSAPAGLGMAVLSALGRGAAGGSPDWEASLLVFLFAVGYLGFVVLAGWLVGRGTVRFVKWMAGVEPEERGPQTGWMERLAEVGHSLVVAVLCSLIVAALSVLSGMALRSGFPALRADVSVLMFPPLLAMLLLVPAMAGFYSRAGVGWIVAGCMLPMVPGAMLDVLPESKGIEGLSIALFFLGPPLTTLVAGLAAAGRWVKRTRTRQAAEAEGRG